MGTRILSALAAALLLCGQVVEIDDKGTAVASGEEGIGYGTASVLLRHQPKAEGDPTVLVVSAPTWSEGRGRLWRVDGPPEREASPLGTGVVTGAEPGALLGRTLAAGDFNDDGFTDLVAGGMAGSSGTLSVAWGEPGGWTSPEVFLTSYPDAVDGQALSVADLDGDGVDDLAAATPDMGFEHSRLLLYYGDARLGPGATGRWSDKQLSIVAAGDRVGAVLEAGVDWTCDGHPDLLTGGGEGLLLLANPTDEAGDPVAWKEVDLHVADLDPPPIELPELPGWGASAHAVGEVSGDSLLCEDVALVSEPAGDGRGELVLIRGRPLDEWLGLPESATLADLAIIRRRGGAPGQGLGAAALPVWWSQPPGPGGGRKPDLLLGAPLGASTEDPADLPGVVLFVPAGELLGPPGAGVVPDDYPSDPADADPLWATATLILEGGWPGWLAGSSLGLWDDRDGDGLQDLLIGMPGWRPDPHNPALRGAFYGLGSRRFEDRDGDGTVALLDCDDDDPERRPGVEELCDGVDTNCDGLAIPFEWDSDRDGWRVCEGDCHDGIPWINPGAEDLCGDIDEDCDGLGIPEDVDDDGDGWTECEGDCDDLDPTRYPGAPPSPTGRDTDCDEQGDWPGGWSCAVGPRRAPGVLFVLLVSLLAALPHHHRR